MITSNEDVNQVFRRHLSEEEMNMVQAENEKDLEEENEWKQFRLSQPVIYYDRSSGLEIRQRDIFEGKNVKGGTTLIVVLRILPDWTYYLINKKNAMGQVEPMCKKCSSTEFIRAIESGDIWMCDHNKVDIERFSLAFIMSEAFLNGSTIEKAIETDEAEMIKHICQANN